MIEMTEKQNKIYDFIKGFIQENKFSPTYRDICNQFEITVRTAVDHVKCIERKGYIKRNPKIARGIVILK